MSGRSTNDVKQRSAKQSSSSKSPSCGPQDLATLPNPADLEKSAPETASQRACENAFPIEKSDKGRAMAKGTGAKKLGGTVKISSAPVLSSDIEIIDAAKLKLWASTVKDEPQRIGKLQTLFASVFDRVFEEANVRHDERKHVLSSFSYTDLGAALRRSETQTEKWRDRQNKNETPLEFMKRVYNDRVKSGLDLSEIRRIDKDLYRAYYNSRRRPNPGESDHVVLYTKKEKYDLLLKYIEEQGGFDAVAKLQLSPNEVVRLRAVAAKRGLKFSPPSTSAPEACEVLSEDEAPV